MNHAKYYVYVERRATVKTIFRTIETMIAIGLLVASSSSFAIPTLKYGGSIYYDAVGLSPADLNVSGVLIPGSTDLSITPDLDTSSVILSAEFLSASSDGNYTTGLFGTTPANDLLISDNNGLNTLLTGNVSTLLLTGREGTNFGILAGTINITGGLLAGDFGGVGSLFAINFNLDTTFNPDMFNSDFFGITNGSITKKEVSLPVPLGLLSIGLFGITMARRLYRRG
jgi:hypothetical protein